MAIRASVVGRNVEMLNGPMLKGMRLGTLRVDERGVHFRSRLLVFSWEMAWEDVADVQLGGDTALRWSNILPVKVAHNATHVTVVDVEGRMHGFVVPRVPYERVHNLFLPSMPRWNRGAGARQG